ncbi:hypothetical protein F4779DRAFT_586149 [Xylariaceae sp. FL0662B]|nr:hypothetical protein F4779DRAFT_586149 [Xylariaceae sp. FL0662B]
MDIEPETPQQPAQQQYTTVGSIWNPQSQPLQPPTRRGRTIKSFLPQYKNESPVPAQQYSPLQQNFDRAVSPTSTGPITETEKRILQYRSMPLPALPLVPSPITKAPSIPDKHHAAIQQADSDDDDVDDDEEANTSLIQMSTKSLTNLASYPNPKQKSAQKILSRARQPPPSMHHLDNLKEQRVPASGLRIARSDPATMTGLLQADRTDEYGSNLNQSFRYPSQSPWDSTARDASGYDVVLSKGPGAPQPLTAGPPGQRQYRSSAFDSTANTLQNSLQRPRQFDNDIFVPNPYNPFGQSRRPMYHHPISRRSSQSFNSESLPSVHAALNRDKTRDKASKVFDTITAEEALPFYPLGLPTDFNHASTILSENWEDEHPLLDRYWTQRSPSVQMARYARVENDFYAGSDRINKTFTQAVQEKNRRNVARAVGAMYQEPMRNQGKVINRKLTIEEANAIPTSDHVVPLLSMVYQSLINHPEFSPYTNLPKYDEQRNPLRWA